MVMPFKVPPAWSLVLVGLVLNILAIVMSVSYTHLRAHET